MTGFYNRDGVCLLRGTFCPHSVFMCFVWIWEQTAIISLYSTNWLVSITEMVCVYCAVRAECLHTIHVSFTLTLSTLTVVFLWFFLRCKDNARVQLKRRGTARTPPQARRLYQSACPRRVPSPATRPLWVQTPVNLPTKVCSSPYALN
jgi:hypothetical protein